MVTGFESSLTLSCGLLLLFVSLAPFPTVVGPLTATVGGGLAVELDVVVRLHSTIDMANQRTHNSFYFVKTLAVVVGNYLYCSIVSNRAAHNLFVSEIRCLMHISYAFWI